MKLKSVALTTAQFALFLSGLHAQINPVAQPDARTPIQVTSGSAQLMGAYDPSQKLRLVFGLKPPKAEEEQKFLDALYTEGSPQYHKFLTPKEWNDRFAPSAADEQAVVDWVTSAGLTVTRRYPNRLIVDIEGQVGQIQKAMGVNINRYQLNGSPVYSNNQDPVIPPALSGVVSSVLGLNNIQVMEPHTLNAKQPAYPDYSEGPMSALASEIHGDGDARKLALAMAAKKNAPSASLSGTLYDPTDIYSSNAYNYDALQRLGHCCNPNHNPAGSPAETSIAIATAGAQNPSDLPAFQARYPYLAFNLSLINVGGTPVCCDVEGTLDAQWATATANSFGSFQDTSHVYVYQGVDNKHSTFISIFNQMLTDGFARVMSTSWGCAEFFCATTSVMDTENAIFNAMAAQGWTLVADSDDKGSTADCAHLSVEFPASSPNVIAAGGTLLTLFSDSSYFSEGAWTGATFSGACASNNGGGGGGFSHKYSAPLYQAFLNTGVRTLPDVSLNAAHSQAIIFNGGLRGGGGTSIATPEMAGFFAQENAYLLYLQNVIGTHCFGNNPCAPIGNANFYMYSEQRQPAAPHFPFYDIASGCASNDITLATGLPFFCAAPNYDLATGLGSVNMLQLAWAINYHAAGDFGAPQATFTGAAINTWYNSPRTITVSFADTTQSPRAPTGLAGFTILGWDGNPSRESYSKSTPGINDAFYDGPSNVSGTSGSLDLQSAGEGCHFFKARAWDNTGTPTGVLSYGPVCYDTVPPVSSASLSGTRGQGGFTSTVQITLAATDVGGGVAKTFYDIDGGVDLTYTAPFLVPGAGAHTVHYFSRDVAGNIESSQTVTFTIILPATTTHLTSSLNPAAFGASIGFTATVTAASGSAPNGTVTFKDGSTVLGTAALSGGQAAFATNLLHGGGHLITAVYDGGDHDLPSTSSALSQTVNKAVSTTNVTSSLNPSSYGQAVTLTAAVSSSRAGSLPGAVTFKDGNTVMGTANVDASNKAAFVTSTLTGGSHSITATYGGSVDDQPSTSAGLMETVNRAGTTTNVASALNPVVYGSPATFTASVIPAFGGLVTGTVTFRDGASSLGIVAVDPATGQATLTTSAINAGSRSITAMYNGSPNHAASTSAVLNETVDKANAAVTISSSLNPSDHGGAVTFTATVVPQFGGSVSGAVTFKDGATTLGSGVVNASTQQATFTTPALVVGTHTITANYAGNANLNGGASAPISQVVR